VCIEHREAVAVFFRDENSLEPEQLAVINERKGLFDEALAGLLQEGADAGEFDLVDARTTALAIGGMISWTYLWYRPQGRLSAETLMDQMARYALRIAGARQPG
jgi:TetR/AcrR family transcriptional regulator, cholesterol catabolism regulator